MQRYFVVDTSIVVKWVNQSNELDIDLADRVMHDAIKRDIQLFAPELAKYELGNVLIKGKRLQQHELQDAISTTYALPISFIPETKALSEQTFEQAFLNGLTYYDAAFLALAFMLDCPLITDNIKHQGKNKAHKVITLQDYLNI